MASKWSNDESFCEIKAVGRTSSLGSAVNMSMASLNESMATISKVKSEDESVMLVRV